MRIRLTTLDPLALGAAIGLLGCATEPAAHEVLPAVDSSLPRVPVTVIDRSAGLVDYPCSGCHAERQVNPRPRQLSARHSRIELSHGFSGGWCYRCHAEDDSDSLRLSDGSHVPMQRIDTLCGSCHGDEHRGWEQGIHGHTTGSWREHRRRATCTECHDAHRPGIEPYAPEPPPAPPKEPSFWPSAWRSGGAGAAGGER